MNMKARLFKGATVIGKFWRDGLRCSAAWAPSCTDEQQTDFCKAKMRWVELALQDGRQIADTPSGILSTGMLAREFDATGITMTIDNPDHGLVRVGPKGELLMSDLAKLETEPDGIGGFLKILKVFPRAAVVGVEEGDA